MLKRALKVSDICQERGLSFSVFGKSRRPGKEPSEWKEQGRSVSWRASGKAGEGGVAAGEAKLHNSRLTLLATERQLNGREGVLSQTRARELS